MTLTEQIDNIIGVAKDVGYTTCCWDYGKKKFWFISGGCHIQGHWNIYDNAFSVRTKLKHPNKGYTELWRNHLTLEDVIRIVMNPREHVNKQAIYVSK